MSQFKKIKKNTNKVVLALEAEGETGSVSNGGSLEVRKDRGNPLRPALNMGDSEEENLDEAQIEDRVTMKRPKTLIQKRKLELKRTFHQMEQGGTGPEKILDKMQEKTMYDESEIQALKLMNQSQNLKAKELIEQLSAIPAPAENAVMIEETPDPEAEILLNEKASESELEETDRVQIEDAKKERENKRRAVSGEYIPLQNRDKDFFEKSEKERIYMSGVRVEEDRIKKEFKEEEKTRGLKRPPLRFVEDDEDEFERYEKKLIKKAMKSKNVTQNLMANQDHILDNCNGELKALKPASYAKHGLVLADISYEFIGRILEENSKTNDATLENTKKKLESLESAVADSERFLQASGSISEKLTADFLDSQKNLEFWTEFADMLSEKGSEVQNAKEKLAELKKAFAEKSSAEVWEELNESFLENDGIGVPGYVGKDPSAGINIQTAKLATRLRLLGRNPKKSSLKSTNDEDSFESGDDAGDLRAEFEKTKTEFFNAVEEIFNEVEPEFKQIGSILTKFKGLPNDLTEVWLNEKKTQGWVLEIVRPFFEVELLKFDPFGQRADGILDLKGLGIFEEIRKVQPGLGNELGSYLDSALEILWETAIPEKLAEVISKDWDVFSKEHSYRIRDLINEFIEQVYKKNPEKLQRNLKLIQQILTVFLHKINENLKFCLIPTNVFTAFAKHQIFRNLRLVGNLIRFSGFLPLSNITRIVFENLLNEEFFSKIRNIDLRSKIKVAEKIFMSLEERVLNCEPAKRWVLLFSYFLNLTLNQIETSQQSSINEPTDLRLKISNILQNLSPYLN